MYHSFGVLSSLKKLLSSFAILFFIELELHKKLVAIFHGTGVCETQITRQTQV